MTSIWEKEQAEACELLEKALGLEGRAYTIATLARIAATRLERTERLEALYAAETRKRELYAEHLSRGVDPRSYADWQRANDEVYDALKALKEKPMTTEAPMTPEKARELIDRCKELGIRSVTVTVDQFDELLACLTREKGDAEFVASEMQKEVEAGAAQPAHLAELAAHLWRLLGQAEQRPWFWEDTEEPEEEYGEELPYVPQGSHINGTLITLDDTYENSREDCALLCAAVNALPELLIAAGFPEPE